MLNQIDEEKILFFDIETVPEYEKYSEMSEKKQELWTKKIKFQSNQENLTSEELYKSAGIYAEFGKIVCISVGFIYKKQNTEKFRIKSYYGHDERKLIYNFNQLLNNHFNTHQHYLCGHNSKEFDIPYVARRSLINGLELPHLLDLAGKKPWEVKHIDTLDLWKFGDYKHYTSIALLAEIFNIPTPKDDIDGSMVADVYWKEKNLQRIVEYCQKDVLTVAQLFRKYKIKNLINENDVEIIN